MTERMYDYVESRLPEKLKKDIVCPECGSYHFYVQTSTFVNFSFGIDGKLVYVNNDYDDWNKTEQVKCQECGVEME